MPSERKEQLLLPPEHMDKAGKATLHPRIVVLGATGVGKTSIIQQFFYQSYPLDHVPTVEELYNSVFSDSGSTMSLDVLDTSGYYEFPAMRRLAIRTADAFVLVYAINDKESFKQVCSLRDLIVEIREQKDSLPILVVGNKCDLKDCREVSRTITESVVTMDWENKFLEVSAKMNVNVQLIFQEVLTLAHVCHALAAAIERRRKSCPVPSSCTRLNQVAVNKRHSCNIQ